MKRFLACLILLAVAGCGQKNVTAVVARSTPSAIKPSVPKTPAKKPQPVVFLVEFSPDGKMCAIVFRLWNSQLHRSLTWLELWDVKAEKRLFKKSFDYEVTDLAFLPHNQVVLVSNGIYLIDCRSSRIMKQLAVEAHTKFIEATPDGKSVLFAHRDYATNNDALEFREAKTWKLLRKVKIKSPRGAFIKTVSFSPDGKRVVTGAWDIGDGIEAYNLQSGRRLWTSNGDQEGNILWSPNGKVIASSVTEGVFLLNSRNGRLLKKLKADYGTTLRFSADGGLLLFLKDNKPITYDLRSGKESGVAELPMRNSQLIINGLTVKELDGYLSDNGRLLAQVSEDGSQVTFKSLNW